MGFLHLSSVKIRFFHKQTLFGILLHCRKNALRFILCFLSMQSYVLVFKHVPSEIIVIIPRSTVLSFSYSLLTSTDSVLAADSGKSQK